MHELVGGHTCFLAVSRSEFGGAHHAGALVADSVAGRSDSGRNKIEPLLDAEPLLLLTCEVRSQA
eukprot:9977833-Alexandrium_andersonii.AAC.1